MVATAFCFFAWVVGEQVLTPIWAATQNNMNEQGQQISQGLRYEWLAIPVIIACLLWVWAAIVVTRRQVTTAGGPYYYLRNFVNDKRGIVQVIVVGGMCMIIAGLFWIVFTMPATDVINSVGGVSAFASDAQLTVSFINLFIGGMPIIAGLVTMAWGFTRTIEERETGMSTV